MNNSETVRRRDLPHWDKPGAVYFVTTCLEGSIPARGLLDIAQHRKALQKRKKPENISDTEWVNQQWKRGFSRAEQWLDGEPAVRHLADSRLARVVVDAFYHFAGQRYDLLAFVVMPSHFHWVFQPRDEWVKHRETSARTPREEIIHSINSFTAHRCNHLLNRTGIFWQHESYDHWARDVDELERIMRYVEANPVTAGLTDSPEKWEFSSAHDRVQLGLEFGQPLCRRVVGSPEPPSKPEARGHEEKEAHP